jgi:hypothetical protein
MKHIRAIEDTVLESAILSHMGTALRETGRHDEAIDAFRQALPWTSAGSLHGLAFALVHLAHTSLSADDDNDVPSLLSMVTTWPGGRRTLGATRGLRGGRARLALADGHAGPALHECRQATAMLQDREFPGAQLYEFLAETRMRPASPRRPTRRALGRVRFGVTNS